MQEILKYAKERRIPIMMEDGIEYLCKFIKENHVCNILEIGTAIGYSAIKMASVNERIQVTTIERDYERYKEAVRNVKRMGFDERIHIILKDAMEVEFTETFDLIFIDASKGHNIDFFEKFKVNLAIGGVIITDNLSFHGLVENEELVVTKNQRGLVRKIKKYLEFLDNNPEFQTIYVNVGDKISISKRR